MPDRLEGKAYRMEKQKRMDKVVQLISNGLGAVLLGLWVWAMAMLIVLPRSSQAAYDSGRGDELLTRPASGSLNPEGAKALFDTVVPQQLNDYHIPGGAIVVVKDGKIVYAKGYGYANLERAEPVIADRTLFRTGSVAKLFTWTAFMQLAEGGKLDLDADVNDYLSDFQIPDTYPEPITLEHLMTHTTGFEDASRGMLAARPEDLEPLGAFLAQHVPARVLPPGRMTTYSNYGTALAGHIVERASGMPFEQYVEQHILTPLSMDCTTFRQPVPVPLADDLATGYVYRDGAFRAQPFELYQIGSAGGASATVTDMARFMMAHLADGVYNGARILSEQSAQRMHRQHFGNDPRLAGMAYGFYELHMNGWRLLTHSGETGIFRSQVVLLPEESLGLYIAYSAPGGGLARGELIQAFFDRFYPLTPTTVPQPSPGAAQRASQWAGSYVSSRCAETTIEKLRMLFEPAFQPITVTATQDGYLETELPAVKSQRPGPYEPSRWIETKASLYVRTDGRDWLAFRRDDQGNALLFFDSAAPRGYRRLTWYEGLLFRLWLPVALVVVLFSALAFALFDRQALPAARWLTIGTSGVVLAFTLGLVAYAVLGFGPYLFGEVSPVWWAVFALPVLLLLLTIGLGVSILLPWPGASLLGHVPYAAATVAATTLLFWLNFWNLIGWRF
jgi:CubicO group peptidase (beta-lactamase class C family)